MSYKVELTTLFKKQAKKLQKKHPSLKTEFAELFDKLEQQPDLGLSLGNNCYKIRLAVASKGAGKSGGLRVITHIKVVQSKVYLISVYDKSEMESISDKEIRYYLKFLE